MARRRGRAVDRRLIKRVGWTTLWYQALLCPNLRDDGSHDYTCADCQDGYLYQTPQTIKALFHGDTRDEKYEQAGAWEQGQAGAAVAAHIQIGNRDKLVPQVHPLRDNLVITRGSGQTDTVRSHWVQEILVARTADTTYSVASDLSVSVNKDTGVSTLTWETGGSAPATGERYSILASILPIWIVEGHPKVRAFSEKKGGQIPWSVQLKRDDIAVRQP